MSYQKGLIIQALDVPKALRWTLYDPAWNDIARFFQGDIKEIPCLREGPWTVVTRSDLVKFLTWDDADKASVRRYLADMALNGAVWDLAFACRSLNTRWDPFWTINQFDDPSHSLRLKVCMFEYRPWGCEHLPTDLQSGKWKDRYFPFNPADPPSPPQQPTNEDMVKTLFGSPGG
jgi:hypothetical protein